MAESEWTTFLNEIVDSVTRAIATYLPSVLSAIFLVLIGWGLASLARLLFRRIITTALSGLSKNKTLDQVLDRTGMRSRIPTLVGGFLYWSILMFFIAIGVERLDFIMATTVVGKLAAYLPRVLIGVLLVLLGVLAGHLARSTVTNALATGGIQHAAVGGRIAQGTCVLVGAAVGADQIGIQSTLLTVIVAVLFGAALGGAALAFGIGSKEAVGNLLASSELTHTYQLGQRVRIGDTEGRILEITRTAVILESKEGRVHIPAKRFMKESSILLGGKS